MVVVSEGLSLNALAESFARENDFLFVADTSNTMALRAQFSLHFSESGHYLRWREGKQTAILNVDFVHGPKAHRRKFGGGKGQAIAKAIGLAGKFRPSVLDCTAGQGGDAFVLANLGCQVTMLERSSIAYLLLCDAIERAKKYSAQEGDKGLFDVMEKMRLLSVSAKEYLSGLDAKIDVIYLDPMFPERKKSALVKKEMRAFHHLIGSDDDADELLPLALAKARYRVVVKRAKHAPELADCEPSYTLAGKSTRFDVYALNRMP